MTLLTLSEAAEYLDIPDDGFKMLLRLGNIRYSISSEFFANNFLVDEDYLTVENMRGQPVALDFVRYGPENLPPFFYKSVASNGYLTPRLQEETSRALPNNLKNVNWIEDFDGTILHILNTNLCSSRIELPLPKGEEQISVDALFSQQELDRIKRSFKSCGFIFKSREDYESDGEPFKRPERADEICEAIIDLGNLYWRQKQSVPTPILLIRFMSGGQQKWQVVDKPSGRKSEIEIEGETISYDAFKKRYNKYLGG